MNPELPPLPKNYLAGLGNTPLMYGFAEAITPDTTAWIGDILNSNKYYYELQDYLPLVQKTNPNLLDPPAGAFDKNYYKENYEYGEYGSFLPNKEALHSTENHMYIITSDIYPKSKHNIKLGIGSTALSGLTGIKQSPLTGNFNSLLSSPVDLRPVIKPEDLAEMSLPVVDFIDDTQPHIIVGCDRGGRMFSLAVRAAWKQLHPGEKFPTMDGKVHFARISTTEDETDVQAQFDIIVEQAQKQAALRGESPEDNLRILFIDDWIAGGGTRRLTERLAAKHGASSYFAVMRGGKADVSGMPDHNWIKPKWSDKPEMMGVNYISLVETNPKTGELERSHKVEALRNAESNGIRRQMYNAIRQLKLVRTPEQLAA